MPQRICEPLSLVTKYTFCRHAGDECRSLPADTWSTTPFLTRMTNKSSRMALCMYVQVNTVSCPGPTQFCERYQKNAQLWITVAQRRQKVCVHRSDCWRCGANVVMRGGEEYGTPCLLLWLDRHGLFGLCRRTLSIPGGRDLRLHARGYNGTYTEYNLPSWYSVDEQLLLLWPISAQGSVYGGTKTDGFAPACH